MTDRATVIRVEGGLAWVKVTPKAACSKCPARPLCSGTHNRGENLAARNAVDARPGDDVELEVPESDYSRVLIAIFGWLLIASLAGLALGYILSPFSRLDPAENGFIGLLAGLLLGGLAIHRHYSRAKGESGWPVVVKILKKGGCHG